MNIGQIIILIIAFAGAADWFLSRKKIDERIDNLALKVSYLQDKLPKE